MDQKQVCTAVMRRLNNLRLTESLCDITLMVGDIAFPAHKCILAATSKFFQNILGGEDSSVIFQINGINAGDMMLILDFLYTGQMHITKHNVDAIDTLGKQLQIELLHEVCSTFKTPLTKTRKQPEKYKQGSSRTRTYSRWGKKHSLNRPKSPDSDLSDFDSCSSSRHEGDNTLTAEHGGQMNIANVPVTSCGKPGFLAGPVIRIPEQQINEEPQPIVPTDQDQGKNTIVPQTDLALLNPVLNSLLKGGNSDVTQEDTQDHQVSTNILVLSDIETTKEPKSNSNATGSIQNGRLPRNCPPMKRKERSGDMEPSQINGDSNVSMYENLAETDPQKNHAIVTDSSNEYDLNPFLDIQNFFASYTSHQNPIHSETTEGTMNNTEQRNSGESDKLPSQIQSNVPSESPAINLDNTEVITNPHKDLGEINDNMKMGNVTVLAAANEDAGFHDYCMLTDHNKLMPSERLDLPNEEGMICQNDVETVIAVNEIEVQPQSGTQPEDQNNILPPPNAQNISESNVDGVIEDGGDQNSHGGNWRDTHIMIIKQSAGGSKKNSSTKDIKVWPCPWCTCEFPKEVKLKRHAKSKHPERVHKCSFCQRVFMSVENSEKHMDWCRVQDKVDGRFLCPLCSYTAVKKYHVVEHFRGKHTTRYQRKCDRCDEVFNTVTTYYDHLLLTHEIKSQEITDKKVHECKNCQFRTVKRYAYKSHCQQHERNKIYCNICEKRFKTVQILKEHKKVLHGKEKFNCSVCAFTSRYAVAVKTHEYRRHKMINSHQKVHFCPYCDYSNVSQSALRKHELNKHSDERPFLCPHSYCSKAFKHKYQVTQHETRIHTGVQSFKCNLCSYTGNTHRALVAHRAHEHSIAQDYVCKLCGFTTKVSGTLRTHRVKFHKKLGLKALTTDGQTERHVMNTDQGPQVE